MSRPSDQLVGTSSPVSSTELLKAARKELPDWDEQDFTIRELPGR